MRLQNHDAIIFDLDGVLWDTCRSCAVGWNRVVTRHQIPFREITADDIRAVAGKPHDQCIRLVFTGLGDDTLDLLARETAVEDNAVVSEMGGDLFNGVSEGIQILSTRWPLFIVSNCQSGYIETFLKWSGLSKHFLDFECWGNTGRPKAENLRAVIDRNQLKNPVFIGDTEGDQVAARKCGVPFLFANYGFGKCSDYDLRLSSFLDLMRLADIRAGASLHV